MPEILAFRPYPFRMAIPVGGPLLTSAGVMLGLADVANGGGFNFEGLAALVTACTGMVATVWAIYKGSKKKEPMSPEDLAALLDAIDKRGKP